MQTSIFLLYNLFPSVKYIENHLFSVFNFVYYLIITGFRSYHWKMDQAYNTMSQHAGTETPEKAAEMVIIRENFVLYDFIMQMFSSNRSHKIISEISKCLGLLRYNLHCTTIWLLNLLQMGNHSSQFIRPTLCIQITYTISRKTFIHKSFISPSFHLPLMFYASTSNVLCIFNCNFIKLYNY